MTDSGTDAKRYAFRLLSYRGRSESEIRERLGKKGFTGDVVAQTLDFLKGAGFIDDAALALNLKRQAVEQKLLGHAAARLFMQRRGLPKDLVDATLGYNEDEELQSARKLLDKKLRSVRDCLTIKERKRLYDFFARRGFAPAVIHRALRDIKFCEGDGE